VLSASEVQTFKIDLFPNVQHFNSSDCPGSPLLSQLRAPSMNLSSKNTAQLISSTDPYRSTNKRNKLPQLRLPWITCLILSWAKTPSKLRPALWASREAVSLSLLNLTRPCWHHIRTSPRPTSMPVQLRIKKLLSPFGSISRKWCKMEIFCRYRIKSMEDWTRPRKRLTPSRRQADIRLSFTRKNRIAINSVDGIFTFVKLVEYHSVRLIAEFIISCSLDFVIEFSSRRRRCRCLTAPIITWSQ